MVQTTIYPINGDKLAILTIRDHLCGFFELKTSCVDAGSRVDPVTGHMVCCGCGRITVASGLMQCDICNRDYINKSKRQDKRYETNCPSCIIKFGLDDDV